jgi:hypothetical protein
VAAVRSKLKRFPEVVKADIDIKAGLARMEAKPAFDQYVALAHSLEEAGGAIQMFHPEYLVPQAHYAMLGVRGRTDEKMEALQKNLQAVPGVRSAIIDPDRWFTNERGVDVGGVVVFADTNPRLKLGMIQAAGRAGFLLEPRDHGHNAGDAEEWSEMNHAFAGVCLLCLTVLGVLQVSMKQPPQWARYGTPLIWLSLAVFLFFRADRGSWPLGPLSWWEGFQEWDTLGHRVGILLLVLIGAGDFLRVRRGLSVNPTLSKWGILAVGVVGSTMLYTHLHQTIDPAHYALVVRMNVQHVLMATSALLFALSKFAWETWRLPKRGGQYVYLGFLGVLGMILTLYVE